MGVTGATTGEMTGATGATTAEMTGATGATTVETTVVRGAKAVDPTETDPMERDPTETVPPEGDVHRDNLRSEFLVSVPVSQPSFLRCFEQETRWAD